MASDPDIAAVAGGLTEVQRRALLDVRELSGPSGDCYVSDQSAFDALYYDAAATLCTPGGRILPLGLAVRDYLKEQSDGQG